MAEIIHKIFVSSTYEDLREERAELQKALLKLGCLPVGMELFPSADEETWEFIKKQIEDSDYYVVIVAGRYGTEAADGLGFTEKEYDFARTSKKPVMAFIHGNPDAIPAGKVDNGEAKRQKLAAFKQKIQRSPVNFYTNPHELALNALASFVDLRVRYPATGFIRADQAVDQRKYIDMLEENARLKEKLQEIQSNDFWKSHDWTEEVEIKFAEINEKEKIVRENSVTVNWKTMFLIIAQKVMLGPFLERWLLHFLLAEATGEKPSYTFRSEFEPRLKTVFYASGLFEVEERTSNIGGFDRYLVLTDYGRQQFVLLNRI